MIHSIWAKYRNKETATKVVDLEEGLPRPIPFKSKLTTKVVDYEKDMPRPKPFKSKLISEQVTDDL